MKDVISMQEAHNRQIQDDIDFERKEISEIKKKKNSLLPKIQNLEWELEQINIDVRKMDIDMDCRLNRIKILTDRFWKN